MKRLQSIDLLKSMKEVKYVTYGCSDLGIPIPKEAALLDWESIDNELWGDGTWYVCDKKGNF